jgi:4-hydroxyphenylacetate 3-monooxygenase/4-hydroxybutyryl-CoA dehydratase/vinylacetyl-CoA-Delta-isomerase
LPFIEKEALGRNIMRTYEEYLEKLKSMKSNLHFRGELIRRDGPQLEQGRNNIRLTFDLAEDQKNAEVFTAFSPIIRSKINRFCHVHNCNEDLLNKQQMTRVACNYCSSCVQRCMGVDAFNALSIATYEIDQAKGTEYYQRFKEYAEYFQKGDLVGCCAQTDVKGDRMLRPHEQADKDQYVRVVGKTKDGIIVRGAKINNSSAALADEIIVVPTRALGKEDADWAVAFAVPADWDRVHQIVSIAGMRRRNHFPAPVANFGGNHSLTVFDDAFIPWERVFMCGEWEFGGKLAQLFALFHRHSYTGCKAAVGDMMIGFAALVAEYNGIARSQHVRSRLAELISVTELVYASGIAASVKAKPAGPGTYVPDIVYCNVGRKHAGTHIYREYEILCELAGGLAASIPVEEDFVSPDTGKFVSKYLRRKEGITPEQMYRCFSAVADIICSEYGSGVRLIAGVHGGGSPIMEDITMLANYDLNAKKEIAKYLAGIK